MNSRVVGTKTALTRSIPLIVVLFSFTGCSGGPSASDIKAAAQESWEGIFGTNTGITVEDVSDVSCKEAQGKPGYICSFNMTAFNKMQHSRNSQATEARFVQNGSKWTMMIN